MPEISENALMMAIQAIHQVAAQNAAARAAVSGPEQADYDEVIEAYEIAAIELRGVYERACVQGSDLPPYATLASRDLSGTS